MGFFVPFVVLELIERLGKRPTFAGLAEATKMPAEKSLAVTVSGQIAALFALAFHMDLCLETINFALTKSILEVKSFKMNRFITRFSPLVACTSSMSLKMYESAPTEIRSQVVGLTLGIGSFLLLYVTFLETIHMWGRWSEIAITILAIAVAITGTLAHLFVYLRFTSTTLRQLFSGANRHKQKFMEQWVA